MAQKILKNKMPALRMSSHLKMAGLLIPEIQSSSKALLTRISKQLIRKTLNTVFYSTWTAKICNRQSKDVPLALISSRQRPLIGNQANLKNVNFKDKERLAIQNTLEANITSTGSLTKSQKATLSLFGEKVQKRCLRNGVNSGINQPFSSALTLDVTKDSSRKQIYRTMDHGEFKKACMMAANLIGQMQNQTNKLRKNPDSPDGFVNIGCQSSSNMNSKIKSLNLHNSGVVLPVPSLNYLAGQLSDGRSNSVQDTQQSRFSTKVPLVMRHCFHNNEEKKKMVEANKAVWLENRRSFKARSPSSLSQQETITCKSPQSNYSGFDNQIKLKAMEYVMNKESLLKRSASPKNNLDLATKLENNFLTKTLALQDTKEEKKSRNLFSARIQTTQSDHFSKNKLSIFNNHLAEKLRADLVKLKSNQIVDSRKLNAFSPLNYKGDRANYLIKTKMKSVLTPSLQTNTQVDSSKAFQRQIILPKTAALSPKTEAQGIIQKTRNFKLPISSGNALKTVHNQLITPSTNNDLKRDSKLRMPLSQQNSKVAQQSSRCTNISLNPFVKPNRQSCAPFSKSIFSSQTHQKTTQHVQMPSSMYLSTVSPVKSLKQDSKGEAALETDSNTYPAVQTQNSCLKGEILVYASTKAAQMKTKQTFRSSLVTKSTNSKPNSNKQTVNKHSHGKSSDYQFSQTWRTPSLATAATGGKLGSGSFLTTPYKFEPVSAIAIPASAQIDGRSAYHLKTQQTSYFKRDTMAEGCLNVQQKSRKHCKNLQNSQNGNRDCSISKMPLSPSAKKMPESSPKAYAITSKYLDTIQSVEGQSQKQICKIQNSSSNANNMETVAAAQVIQQQSSLKQNTLYKLPHSAQSPIVLSHRSEIKLNVQDKQNGQIQSSMQSKTRFTNSQKKDLQSQQLETYAQRLHAKENIKLRSNNLKQETSQTNLSQSQTLLQEDTVIPRADLLQKSGRKRLHTGYTQPIVQSSLQHESIQNLSATCTQEKQLIKQEIHFKMAKAKLQQDKKSQQQLAPKQESANKRTQLSQNSKSMLSQQEKKMKSRSFIKVSETLTTKGQDYGIESFRKVVELDQYEPTRAVEVKKEFLQTNSSYFAAAAVKQAYQKLNKQQISLEEQSLGGRDSYQKNVKPKIKSGQTSHQASMANLSMAKTESIAFQPSNPLKILRKIQRDQNYVWLATYDEDIQHSGFMRKIGHCIDQCLPWEFVPWRLYDFQPFLINENSLCLRREPGKETLCKIYLVHIDQVKDIVRYKNHMCERKYLMSQGILIKEDEIQSMSQLREKYQISKLRDRPESPSLTTSSNDSLSYIPDERTISLSIPDEPPQRPNFETSQNNYIVTMEGRREFDDLQDVENPPVLDLIYHEQTAMGLPIVFATNRDQSKLDDSIPVTPSYFKHLRSMKPDTQLLIKFLHGLIQSFPEFTAQELMINYIEQIPGICGKLTEQEVFEIIEQSINGVSLSSEQPHTKLLSAEETSKMFELMNNQLDPHDLNNGYQSLSIYYEKQYQYDQVDRDVVFLGAENSEILVQNDLTENQLNLIEQFNKDFQLQQQKFMLSSGYKNGLHGVCFSETSQVDNFIFQNNINRFSNEVSRDYEDATPIREGVLARNVANRLNVGTNGIQSINASSYANRQESGNTTSYQGACRILNFQQPLFQSNQWNNNSGFGEDSAKEEEGPMNINNNNKRINRGSSVGLFSVLPSPPYKNNKQLNSANKQMIFTGENSAIDYVTSSSAFGGIPNPKRTIFTKHKQFNSNVPSSHRTEGYFVKQAGYEIPIEEDFVTNVQSIKPIPNNNSSVCQASNSLFIQSGRSRNKDSSQIKKEAQRKRLNVNPSNRFEMSQEDLEKDFIGAELPQEEFEEVMCHGAGSCQSQSIKQWQGANQLSKDLLGNNPEVDMDSDEDDPVSIRQQLVSDLSIRKKRRGSLSNELNPRKPATEIDLDASKPEVELFDQVSDFVQKTGRHNLLHGSQSSKELVLQENKASSIHSYRKVRHSLSKRIRLPVQQKLVKTEEKKMPTALMENSPSFMEDAFEQMIKNDIRRELFQSCSKDGLKN